MNSKNTEPEQSNIDADRQNAEMVILEQHASFQVGIQFLGGLIAGMVIVAFFTGYYGWFLGAKIPSNFLTFLSVFSVICGFLAVFLKKEFWQGFANLFGFFPN